MKKNLKRDLKRVFASFIAASMTLNPVSIGGNNHSSNMVMEAQAATPLEEMHELSTTDIPDSTLYSILQVLANYDGSDLSALETDDLTSDKYKEYRNKTFTVKDLAAYTGNINLSVYAGRIKDIKGLGYATGATKIDLSKLDIAKFDASEFSNCGNLAQIILPKTLKSLPNYAFDKCTSLKTLSVEGDEVQENVIDLSKIDELGEYTFYGCSSISKVNFKEYDSKKELVIGKGAFAGCTSITKIDIPIENADHLGTEAFAGCTSLSEVKLRDNLSYIPANIFSQAILKKINIPTGITYIGESAFQESMIEAPDFSHCTKLKKIGASAFARAKIYKRLKEGDDPYENTIKLPDCLESIGTGAFNASSIMAIEIPAKIERIEDITFASATDLKYIRFKDEKNAAISYIGKKAFQKCYALTDTDFLMNLKNLTTIDDEAFANCTWIPNSDYKNTYGLTITAGHLKRVNLPDCVTTLGVKVFAGDYELESVELGNGITEIPDQAFACMNAANMSSNLSTVILSKGLKTIGNNAFEYCRKLNKIGYKKEDGTVVIRDDLAQFPNTLTTIGDNAFHGDATDLKQSTSSFAINIDRSDIHTKKQEGDKEYLISDQKSVKPYIAYFSPSKIIDVPQNTNKETENTIYVWGEKKYVDLSKSGSEKLNDDNTFYRYMYMDYKHDITSYNGDFTYIDSLRNTTRAGYQTIGNIDTINKNTYIYSDSAISDTPKEGYTEAFVMTTAFTDYKEANAITHSQVYYYQYGLADITLPDSVTKLGEKAFADNSFLNNVKLSDGLKSVSKGAFMNCGKKLYASAYAESDKTNQINGFYRGLNLLTLPKELETIENDAFGSCYNLKLKSTKEIKGTVYGQFPDTLTSIGNNAFTKCLKLENIWLPSKLESIGDNAFAYAAEQEDLKIQEVDSTTGLTKNRTIQIPLKGNGALTKVAFDNAVNLSQIGSGAFRNTAIESAEMGSTKIDKIPGSAFNTCWYMTTAKCPLTVKSVDASAFADCTDLSVVNIPAVSTIDLKAFSGFTGNISKLTLDVNEKKDENGQSEKTQIVPVGQTIELPIKAFSKKTDGTGTLSGTISIQQWNDETNQFEDIKDSAVPYVDYATETDNSGIVKVKLTGLKKGETKIRVGGQLFLQNGRGNIIQYQELIYNVQVKEIPASKISFTDKNMVQTSTGNTLYLKNTLKEYKLQADIEPGNITGDSEWDSDNTGVVSIGERSFVPDKDGTKGVETNTLTINGTGTSKITVKNGIEASCYVKVVYPATSIQTIWQSTGKDATSFSIEKGANEKLIATPKFASNVDDSVLDRDILVYSSSNPEIATIDDNGNIKAVAPGKTTITVKSATGSVSVTRTLNVEEDGYIPPAADITINEKDKTVNVGEDLTFSATILPEKASKVVHWTILSGKDYVSDLTVGTDGKVHFKALKKGTVTLQAATESNIKKTVKITIHQPIESLSILDGNIALDAGKTYSISRVISATATKGIRVTPEDSQGSLKWSTSDAGIVEISQSGDNVTLKAKKQGTATITATSDNGKTASIVVNVSEKVSSINIAKTVTMNVGKKFALNAQKVPAYSPEGITYSSSNPSVATVDGNGVITAKGKGTATITAKTSSVSASCSVTVNQPAKKLTIKSSYANSKKIYVVKGTSFSLGYGISPVTSTDKVTFTSNKKKVALVSLSGSVTAKKTGKAVITVKTSSGKRAKVTVYVVKKAKKAKKVKISLKSKIKAGQTVKVTPKLSSSKSTDTVSYSVSNSAIATVDSYGYLTARKKGTVKVTVTAASGKKAVKKIKVK